MEYPIDLNDYVNWLNEVEKFGGELGWILKKDCSAEWRFKFDSFNLLTIGIWSFPKTR